MTLDERIDILRGIGDDPALQAEHAALCAEDTSFFINTALFICEPRGTSLVDLPYLLRGFQEEYIQELDWHIDNNKNLLTDKTREMGVTWAVEAVLFKRWLFNRGFVSIVSSITEPKIDQSDNPSCLFWKFDYMLESLKWSTPWLYPKGYKKQRPFRSHMKLYNPDVESIIYGEVMGPNLGRSGRSRVIFLDEFAEAKSPSESWASSSRTTNCRIVVFTPKGMNFAGRLANPPKGTPRTINKITLHWMIDETKNAYEVYDKKTGDLIETGNGPADPKYTSDVRQFLVVYPWYEKAKAEVNFDPVKIAQELDVNYLDSVEGLMYPQIRMSRFGQMAYNPSFPLYCSMDYGVGDSCTLVWIQYNPFEKRFVFIDCFEANGKGILWYVPFILGSEYAYLGEAEGGYSPTQWAKIHDHDAYRGKYTAFYGDPSGRNRNHVTNTSVISELAKFGITVISSYKMNNYEIRHKLTQAMLLNSDFNEDACAGVIDAIENSRFKQTSDNKFTPIHDEFSHYRTAVEYFAVNQRHGFHGKTLTKETEAILSVSDESGLTSAVTFEKPDPRMTIREIILPGRAEPVPTWTGEYDQEARQMILHGEDTLIISSGPLDMMRQLKAREEKADELKKILEGKKRRGRPQRPMLRR